MLAACFASFSFLNCATKSACTLGGTGICSLYSIVYSPLPWRPHVRENGGHYVGMVKMKTKKAEEWNIVVFSGSPDTIATLYHPHARPDLTCVEERSSVEKPNMLARGVTQSTTTYPC